MNKNMKVRHFKLEDGKLFVDNRGDFLHINDIELLLRQKKYERQAMVDQYKDSDVEWQKRCHDTNQECVYLIDEILNVI